MTFFIQKYYNLHLHAGNHIRNNMTQQHHLFNESLYSQMIYFQ